MGYTKELLFGGCLLAVLTLAFTAFAECTSADKHMVDQRKAFDQEFLPTLAQYKKFSDAAAVYADAIKRIQQGTAFPRFGPGGDIHWPMGDLDELALAYVGAMWTKVNQGTIGEKEALSRLRLMEEMIVDEYGGRLKQGCERRRDTVAFWAAWKERLASRRLREPVACFIAGLEIVCR